MGIYQNLAGLPGGVAPLGDDSLVPMGNLAVMTPSGLVQLNTEGQMVFSLPVHDPTPGVIDEVYIYATKNGLSSGDGAGIEIMRDAADDVSVSLSNAKADAYVSAVLVDSNSPYNEVDLYSTGGTYSLKRDSSGYYTFYDFDSGYAFMRVQRLSDTDYRLQIRQNNSWVTK